MESIADGYKDVETRGGEWTPSSSGALETRWNVQRPSSEIFIIGSSGKALKVLDLKLWQFKGTLQCYHIQNGPWQGQAYDMLSVHSSRTALLHFLFDSIMTLWLSFHLFLSVLDSVKLYTHVASASALHIHADSHKHNKNSSSSSSGAKVKVFSNKTRWISEIRQIKTTIMLMPVSKMWQFWDYQHRKINHTLAVYCGWIRLNICFFF